MEFFQLLDEIRVPQIQVEKSKRELGSSAASKHSKFKWKARGGKYLSRVIPLGWFKHIDGKSAKEIMTALAIWHLAAMKRRLNDLPLTTKLLHSAFNVSRSSKGRVLRQLEKRGLITVEWRNKKNPLVSIVDIDDELEVTELKLNR